MANWTIYINNTLAMKGNAHSSWMAHICIPWIYFQQTQVVSLNRYITLLTSYVSQQKTYTYIHENTSSRHYIPSVIYSVSTNSQDVLSTNCDRKSKGSVKTLTSSKDNCFVTMRLNVCLTHAGPKHFGRIINASLWSFVCQTHTIRR